MLNYDRRGRGDSTDTLPFALEREVEDLDVLLAAAGGSATVVGLSSGAALAAEAALRGLPIDTLVMWEPPFSVDADGQRRFEEYADRLRAALADGRKADALAHFMRFVGLPDDMIDGMRQSPYWELGERLAPTSAYDAAALGDSTVPTDAVRPDRGTHTGSCRIRESRVPPDRGRPGGGGDPGCPPRGPVRAGPQRRRRGAHPGRGPVPRRRTPIMIRGVGLVCVWVLDLDEARDFYVDTLGFDVNLDMVQDGFRWLVVNAPAQPEVPIMLVVPGPPAVEEGIAEQLRSLVATGYLGPGALRDG